MSSPAEFFSNKKATKKGKATVEAPAFSLTKVQASLGALIVVIAGAAAKLEGPTAVKVAAIGAGALVMVGVFALAAVDLVARQRATEAKLRWGAKESAKAETKAAKTNGSVATETDEPEIWFADNDDLVVQEAHGRDEYEVRFAERKGDTLTVVSRRNGKSYEAAFRPKQ
ncbi:MAG TPA: hypothetical protein VMH33_03875 [Solirubrobacterales bacterium]|nr:hypothetical protein [Solirubrobacterales bacterium]